jgi:predicted transposase/invertase (TIGR01784 family)
LRQIERLNQLHTNDKPSALCLLPSAIGMIDHDRLFKELLSTFFFEFLELFLPELARTIAPNSLRFLPQEYFADLTSGEEKVIDLLVEVQQAGEEMAFLIHVEAQSSTEANFARRMFFYFARLHQKYLQRVFPIVLFSFDEPYRAEVNTYTVDFPQQQVLNFSFKSIQLNRLNWRDFLEQRNPVAAALMAKMRIAVDDRPKVKAECLRLLATLRLDPARTRLISGFVDTYLRLNTQEEQVFQTELGRLETSERETVMEIVTSWMQQGIEQGIEQGREREAKAIVLRQLNRRVGELPEPVQLEISALPVTRLEALGEALLDFASLTDLEAWLATEG